MERIRLLIMAAWGKIKQRPFLSVAVLSVIFIILALSYQRLILGWQTWAPMTGFGEYEKVINVPYPSSTVVEYRPAKKLWDILQILIIPIALAGVALWFNQHEKQTEHKKSLDSRQEANLNNYIEKIGKLLLENGLRENVGDENSPVRDVAQALTVTTLRTLDPARRSIVFRFLQDSKLNKDLLSGASFEEADLSLTTIRGINMSGSDFRVANLRYSGLIDVELDSTNMISANVESSYVSNVNFTNADLRWANLSKSNFESVFLLLQI